MANLFEQATSKVKGGYILIIYPLTFFVFLLSLRLWVEDTMTTVEGYKAIRSAKVGNAEELGWAIALLLQSIPAVFGFWFLRDTKQTTLFVISLVCITSDIVFDVAFKITGYGSNPVMADWLAVAIESVVVFTFGSEITLTISAGFLWQGLMEFAAQVRLFIPAIFALIGAILDGSLTGVESVTKVLASHLPQLGDSDDEEPRATVTIGGKQQSFTQGARDR